MDQWLTLILERGGPAGVTMVAAGLGARWLIARLDQMQQRYLESLERVQSRLDDERNQRLEDRDRHAEALIQINERWTEALRSRR